MRGVVIKDILELLRLCDYSTLVAVRNVIYSLVKKGA